MQLVMDSTAALDPVAVSAALLAVRIVLGAYMVAHGAQKLVGWFGGYGLAATSQFFEQIGFRPGRVFAQTASVTEIVSGALVMLGLFGSLGPALMLSVLIVAMATVHWPNGWFVTANGIEHSLLFATGAVALALAGPGHFSLDTLIGLESLWSARLAGVAIAVACMGGFAMLAARRWLPETVSNAGAEHEHHD